MSTPSFLLTPTEINNEIKIFFFSFRQLYHHQNDFRDWCGPIISLVGEAVEQCSSPRYRCVRLTDG